MNAYVVVKQCFNSAFEGIILLLVILALVISALRFLLPYAHHYKDNIQHYINQTNNSHISIGQLNLQWESFGPSIVAKDVTLLQTTSADVYINKIHIHLDFWRSLFNARVITQDVTLEGAQLLVKNINMQTPLNKDARLIDNIVGIFLAQINRFSLLNSQVVFQTNATEKVLLINRLDWTNNSNRHRAKGDVIVDGLSSNNVKVLLDLEGKELEDLSGQVYLKASQLNITPWLEKAFAIDNKNTHSAINFDGWLTIEQGFPKDLQVAFGDNEINWVNDQQKQFLRFSQGQVLARIVKSPDNNSITGFNLFSSPIAINTSQTAWAPTRFQVSQHMSTTNAYISNIDVKGLADVLPLFTDKKSTLEFINNIKPNGIIEQAFMAYSPQNLSITAAFNEVNTHSYKHVPSMLNVKGEFALQNNNAYLSLSANEGEIDFAHLFKKPLRYNTLSTALNIVVEKNFWEVSSDNVEVLSNDLNLSAEFLIQQQNDEDKSISLLSQVTVGNAASAYHYFPYKIMGDNFYNYLKGAIVKGRVEQAQIILNGPISRFPFANNEGLFSVNAEVTESEFKFANDWPAINNFAANLQFTNNSMLITGRGGDLEKLDVEGVSVAIDSLSTDRVLEVQANFTEVQPQHVTRLMNNSPFKSSVGAALNILSTEQPIAGDFSLHLPLKDFKNAQVKGRVDFNHNKVRLQSPNMLFTEVNGALFYDNDRINANNINLLWRGMPLALNLNTQNTDKSYQVTLAMDAQWQQQEWLSQLPTALKQYGEGDIDWSGIFSLHLLNEGAFTYDFKIDSMLAKTQLHLPAPFSKTANTNLAAFAEITGDNQQTSINAYVGEQLSFSGLFDHNDAAFQSAHLLLGNSFSKNRSLGKNQRHQIKDKTGFTISAQLAQAKVEEWQPFISNIFNSIDDDNGELTQNRTESVPILGAPQLIAGKVDSLSFKNYSLSDLTFSLQNNNDWTIDISAKEAEGSVVLSKNLQQDGVEIKAKYIHLEEVTSEINPHSSADVTEPANTEKTTGSDLALNALKNENIEAQNHQAANILPAQTTLSSNKEAAGKMGNEMGDEIHQTIYKSLPPISFTCESCKLDKIDLGQVDFSIFREANQDIRVKEFSAIRDNLRITLDGLWHQFNSQNLTKLKGRIEIKDLDKETGKLGFASTIKDSGLNSNFNLDWKAPPYEFDISQLNGKFNAKLDDGYLAEVPDQALVFSVLSLQSIVRKLTFDFRDMFADGMFYEKMHGDFQLQNGILYTDNMFMKGSAGDLNVKGNTDLGKKELDIRMSYMPNVTSSLPALAWIATLNPVAFLAGLALEEAITSKVYYEMNFELTGNMSNPIFKDVDKKTRNISVGKSTPPIFIDDINAPDNKPLKKTQKNNKPQANSLLNEGKVND